MTAARKKRNYSTVILILPVLVVISHLPPFSLLGTSMLPVFVWAVNILLESSPIDIAQVKAEISSHKAVVGIEDLHISQITNKMFVATMHLQVRENSISEFEALSKQISHLLYEKFDIGHCTIEPSLAKR